MSYLDKPIDMANLESELTNSASALKALSYLLSSNAEQIGSLSRIEGVELTHGIGGLLGLMASSLHTSACTFSDLHDQLTCPRQPLTNASVTLHLVGGRQHDN